MHAANNSERLSGFSPHDVRQSVGIFRFADDRDADAPCVGWVILVGARLIGGANELSRASHHADPGVPGNRHHHVNRFLIHCLDRDLRVAPGRPQRMERPPAMQQRVTRYVSVKSLLLPWSLGRLMTGLDPLFE